jgi:hypothetical protein
MCVIWARIYVASYLTILRLRLNDKVLLIAPLSLSPGGRYHDRTAATCRLSGFSPWQARGPVEYTHCGASYLYTATDEKFSLFVNHGPYEYEFHI